MREGTWTWWYENGQKEHQIDFDSKSCQRSHWNEYGGMQNEDVEIEYYSDGSIKSKYEWARFTSYYSNGNIESLGEYFRGEGLIDKYEDYCEIIFLDYEPDAYDIAADKRPPHRTGAWNYWYENGLIKNLKNNFEATKIYHESGGIKGMNIVGMVALVKKGLLKLDITTP